MRTMYDSVTPTNIPVNAEMVAGYIDKTLYRWTDAAWARFPNAVKVRIARDASTNDGHVLDVEDRLATPAQVPGWLRMRRLAGADPSVYCNRSVWPQVLSACANASVAAPHFWIATGNKKLEIPAGAVAAQHSLDIRPAGFPGTVDISIVADYWPGVDAPQGTPGGSSGSKSGVELMERKTLPASKTTTVVRLWLPGTDSTAIIIRPRIDANGNAPDPVFWGNIFAWGSDKAGIGHNPKTTPGMSDRVTTHKRWALPEAVWADFEYSSNVPFELDIIG